ncbi:MAG: ABC transporter permease [Gemmatimonadaceae bacterium]
MDHVLTDVRHFLRNLWRSPGYALVSILVLALGTGVGLAALAIAQRALLEPLPYKRAERLFVIFEAMQGEGRRLASYPTVQDWAAQSDVFESISYVTGSQVLLRQPSGPELVTTAYASDAFFQLLGTAPWLGRLLSADDVRAQRGVVLSDALWRRQFGARPDIVGSTVPLGDGGAVVIGVMPPGFSFPEWAEAWMPLGAAPASIQRMLQQRNNHADSRTVARLRDGVTVQQATTRMNAVAAHLAAIYPDDSRLWTAVSLVPMAEYTMSFTSAGAAESLIPRIGLVVGAAALLLLLGCSNVAVLTLVRGLTRSRELAVRAAIGASRARIVRLLVAESLSLAAMGAAAGIGVGYALVRVIQRWNPDLFPRLGEIQLDSTFFTGAVALTLVAGIAAGLVPALRATPRSLNVVLGNARNQLGGGRATNRLQRALIAGQVAVAAMLLVGAGLLIASLKRVIDTSVGFSLEHLSVVGVTPPPKYNTPERTQQLYHALMDAVRQVPGVTAVSFVNHAPLSGASMPTRVLTEGRRGPLQDNEQDLANFKSVSPDYFSTAGIPVVRGRTYQESDLAAPNGTLVINQALARRLWPNEDAIGKRLTVYKSARWLPDFGEPIVGSVIGVIGDVRQYGQETDSPEEVYVPYTWNLWEWGNLVIRSSSEPAAIRESVRRAMLAVEPDLPIGGRLGFQSFDSRLTMLRAPRRLLTAGLALLAAAALGITMLGLYATLAYSVARRRSELGVRFALGATRQRVLGQVMREGLAVVLVGALVGLAGAWAGARVMNSLLYNVSPRDPIVFAAALVPVIVAAIAAIWLPARRAAAMNPTEALRAE